MIILKVNYFSSMKNSKMIIEKLSNKLDGQRIYDYEITDRIQKDVISINTDLSNLRIYIPKDLEYSQYELDDFIRELSPYFRTYTSFDRDIYVMRVSNSFTFEQYYKLVKFIIANEEFCSIIDEEDN